MEHFGISQRTMSVRGRPPPTSTEIAGLRTAGCNAKRTLGPGRYANVGAGRSVSGHNPYALDAEVNFCDFWYSGVWPRSARTQIIR